MRHFLTRLSVLLVTVALPASAYAQQPSPDTSSQPAAEEARSPWLLVPVFSSSPKLGTAGGGLGAYMHTFDADSRVSLFGLSYQYSSTHSQIASAFARTSFGADHHRIVALAAFGHIENDYDDYLGTGQPLKTEDDLKAVAARYLFRATGDWFIGAQANAANYQVLGATAEDDLVLQTLGLRGVKSAAIGAVLMHDSRDNEDMPTTGWFLNVNNLAYREALGGSSSYDAYRLDVRMFWKHGGGHVLAVRQYNWLTSDAPSAAQATVILRGYMGESPRSLYSLQLRFLPAMNYLVHFLLAGDDDELRLGNLLGDFVKGRVERFAHRGLTERLRTGIQMHRTIDAFSDRHPAVHRSKRVLTPEYGRLSGVIVDVFYDHVLARRWSAHHPRPLSVYTQDVYRTLRGNLHRMPAAVHPLIDAMSRGDWLRGYASQRGIERALRGMAARRPVAAEIGTAGRLLSEHFDQFSADFDEFLPDLRARCTEFLAEHDVG